MRLNADWVKAEGAYRVFDRRHPQQTIAYDDNISNIADWAYDHGYEGVSVTDGPMKYIIKQS